jgi:hypothetical protein
LSLKRFCAEFNRSSLVFKNITGTPFARWDTWLYWPLCLLIALLPAGLALLP